MKQRLGYWPLSIVFASVLTLCIGGFWIDSFFNETGFSFGREGRIEIGITNAFGTIYSGSARFQGSGGEFFFDIDRKKIREKPKPRDLLGDFYFFRATSNDPPGFTAAFPSFIFSTAGVAWLTIIILRRRRISTAKPPTENHRTRQWR